MPPNDRDALRTAVIPARAAVLLEPVQGEGGVHRWTPASWRWRGSCATSRRPADLRRGADRHRPLRRLAREPPAGRRARRRHARQGPRVGHPDRRPGGPRDVEDGFAPGDHATTFGATPPVAAAALAVLDTIVAGGPDRNAERVGTYLRERLASAAGRRGRARPRPADCGRAGATARPGVARRLLDTGRDRQRRLADGPGRLCPPLCLSRPTPIGRSRRWPACSELAAFRRTAPDVDPPRCRRPPGLLRLYHAARAFAFGYFFGLGLLALSHYLTRLAGDVRRRGGVRAAGRRGALVGWIAREASGPRSAWRRAAAARPLPRLLLPAGGGRRRAADAPHGAPPARPRHRRRGAGAQRPKWLAEDPALLAALPPSLRVHRVRSAARARGCCRASGWPARRGRWSGPGRAGHRRPAAAAARRGVGMARGRRARGPAAAGERALRRDRDDEPAGLGGDRGIAAVRSSGLPWIADWRDAWLGSAELFGVGP